MNTNITEFNLNRALLDSSQFPPFVVTKTVSLREAIANRQVTMQTQLLVRPDSQMPLGLLLSQMAYHHVAQGAFNGEHWLVAY